MTQCDRSNCKKNIIRRTSAGKAGLCEEHYQTYHRNQQNKERRLLITCQYCGKSLSETRNDKYCNSVCRQNGSRKIISDSIINILSSSYWQNIDHAIKRNPLLLGSVTSPEDIVNYYDLYLRKARHQRSYAIPAYDGYQGALKPVPLLYLEVCHRYPNGRGGANTAENLLLAPKLINRRNNDAIPYQFNGFSGIKSPGECIPFEGSLYNGLVEQYGLASIYGAMSKITPAKCFRGNVAREIKFSGIKKTLPLFTLLHEELWRLGHRKIAECLGDIRQLYPYYPLYLELLAILGFHAVLSGDPDHLLVRMQRIFHAFFAPPHQGRAHYIKDCHKRYCNVMYSFIRKSLLRSFGVKLENKQDVVDFYNRFFSVKVIDIAGQEEICCYIYSCGKLRTEMTFFALPERPSISAVLLGQLNADGLSA